VFGVSDKFFDVKAVGNDTFLALGYRSKLLRTSDGGATWKELSQPYKRSLARMSFVDSEHGWAVGHEGKIYATTDGGQNWSEQKSPTKDPLFDVDFPDAQHGFAVGDLSQIVITADGGQTWQGFKIEMSMIGVREDMSLAISDPIFYSLDFLDEKTGWVVGEFGQIRMTEDGGKIWGAQHGTLLGSRLRAKDAPIRDIMTLPTFLCIRFRDRQHGIVVGTYGAIAATDDGGASWKFSESPVGEPLYDIRPLPDGEWLIVGASGVALRGSADKGWQSATIPNGVYGWIAAADFDSQGHGVAAGAHGLILTSNDYGKTWQQTSFQ
jgi:photosystem II stability/assembly factor-like uncharacterized protein